jgi:ribosome maturation factor RimP
MQFSDTESKIFELIEPTVNSLGFELVLVSITNDGGRVLKVIIDGCNSVKLSINDCKSVSRLITPILDVDDFITGKYTVEVSSAGIERPLVKKSHYDRFIGHQILVRLREPIDERKKYEGKLLSSQNDDIVLEVKTGESVVAKVIKFDIIKSANLVMTDEIFRAILKS